jgi:hypothetical protein
MAAWAPAWASIRWESLHRSMDEAVVEIWKQLALTEKMDENG